MMHNSLISTCKTKNSIMERILKNNSITIIGLIQPDIELTKEEIERFREEWESYAKGPRDVNLGEHIETCGPEVSSED